MKTYYSFNSFFSYMKRYKLRMVAVVASFLVSNAFISAVPIFIGKLVGVLAAASLDKRLAITYLIVLILCSTFHDITWRLSEYLYYKLMFSAAREYENIVFTQVVRKPYPFFVDKFTGKIAYYVTTLGEEFRAFVDAIFWNYAAEFVHLFAVIAIFMSVNIYTGLLFVSGLILMVLIGRISIRNSNKYEKISTDVNSTKNGKIIDSIANYINIKSFQKENTEQSMVESEQRLAITAAKTAYRWNVMFWITMTIVVREMIWPLTLILNLWLFFNNKISLAEITTILSAILLFSDYVWGLIWNVSQFNLKLAKIEESYLYLFGKTNIVKDPLLIERDHHVKDLASSVQFNKLSFAYPDKPDTKVLQNISLTIKKNEKVGIVGRSGSGKTTLTKLMLGYYDLPADQIKVDGKPVGADGIASIISFVPQDTSLFHRSLADNIAYATERTVTQKDIEAAAKKAHAHEFISQIEEGYDVLVGERGVKLSTGQRQRIAIARAFLDDKPLLILDEATSALDSESEVLIQSALEKLWENKTVIAIAHRLSTLRHMDRIVVMDKGRIVEQGSHAELIKAKGAYYSLWQHQNDGMLAE